MFMCVVNLKLVNKLDLTWKQSFLIIGMRGGDLPWNFLNAFGELFGGDSLSLRRCRRTWLCLRGLGVPAVRERYCHR